jgi:anti-sigma factor RsiW
MSNDDCRDCAKLVEVYLDGELAAADTVRVEDHLADCSTCRERGAFLRAVRGSLQRTVKAAATVDASMRDRMMAAMRAEATREQAQDTADAAAVAAQLRPLDNGDEPAFGGLFSWRTLVPLASAAAIALAWNAVSQETPRSDSTADVRAGFGHDPLADIIAEHSKPLPPEADARNVHSLSKYVGVPVRPPGLQRVGAKLVGGRVLSMHEGRAAMLQYEIPRDSRGGAAQRVSLFIYDPRKIQVGHTLSPRTVGTANVQVGKADGYTVTVTQREGVGYAMATDLDEGSSAELAALTMDE